jgi:leucyl aminopeptidase
MRLELREAADGDVVAQIDRDLPGGEVVRDGSRLLVGHTTALGLDGLRQSAALGARSLRRTGGAIAWRTSDALEPPPGDQVRALVEGSAFGAYDPGLRKSSYPDRPEVVLVLDVDAALHPVAERQAVVSAHLDQARDLANLPPNELTPVALAQHALELRHPHLTVEAYGREWIEAQGMGAFAAVASGSAKEPQLIVLRYEPPGAAAAPVLGLVGKAITFDSGGVSLKVPLRMQDMKGDMCGGGAVIEATAAVAELGLPVRILGVVASTENLQDGDAFRPGDILRAANGKTIEIINTDAEGRLLLADALHYARTAGATHIVDFATLTGAMSIALGDLYGGWFCNDEPFAAELDAAAGISGDLAWRFPLHPRYRRYVDSDFADMKNGSELREGSPILAAEFLREFSGDGPWAHFDIAGPAFIRRRRPDYALDQGGTGYGVRLMVELAQRLAG